MSDDFIQTEGDVTKPSPSPPSQVVAATGGDSSSSSSSSSSSTESGDKDSEHESTTDFVVGSKRRRLSPTDTARYLSARHESDMHRGENANVARVRDARGMRLFDEWFWLVYIGCRGIYDYRQLSVGHKEQCAERALHQHRDAILQQQSERWRLEFERADGAGQLH